MPDKFNFDAYDPTITDEVFSEANGYVEPGSEAETRKQLSTPSMQIKDFINNELFDGDVINVGNIDLVTHEKDGLMSHQDKIILDEATYSQPRSGKLAKYDSNGRLHCEEPQETAVDGSEVVNRSFLFGELGEYQKSLDAVYPVYVEDDGEIGIRDGYLLPEVTSADNGKVLQVVNGEWMVIKSGYDLIFDETISFWYEDQNYYSVNLFTEDFGYFPGSFTVEWDGDQYDFERVDSEDGEYTCGAPYDSDHDEYDFTDFPFHMETDYRKYTLFIACGDNRQHHVKIYGKVDMMVRALASGISGSGIATGDGDYRYVSSSVKYYGPEVKVIDGSTVYTLPRVEYDGSSAAYYGAATSEGRDYTTYKFGVQIAVAGGMVIYVNDNYNHMLKVTARDQYN